MSFRFARQRNRYPQDRIRCQLGRRRYLKVPRSKPAHLANQSVEASKGTALLIENAVRAVRKGTQLVGYTAEFMEEVGQAAQRVSVTVTDIAKVLRQEEMDLLIS